MYNRNWLQEQLVSWLKDDSVGGMLDIWIDLGAKRVSQFLECFEMEVVASNTLRVLIGTGVDGGFADSGALFVIDGGDAYNDDPDTAPKDYIPLPAGFKRLVTVQSLENDVWRNLKSIPKHEATHYKSFGPAQGYLIEDRRIYPLPFREGDYRAIYLAETTIPIGDNENDVLTAYPMLFLAAALAEAYDWKQDAEMQQRWETKWINEADQIKLLYRSERTGDTPAMRAV